MNSPDAEEHDVYCFKLGETNYSTEIFLVLLLVQEAEAGVPKFRRIGLGKTGETETQFFAEAEVKAIELL
jgi:hypothetical protein